jgi:hypothetical protein
MQHRVPAHKGAPLFITVSDPPYQVHTGYLFEQEHSVSSFECANVGDTYFPGYVSPLTCAAMILIANLLQFLFTECNRFQKMKCDQ